MEFAGSALGLTPSKVFLRKDQKEGSLLVNSHVAVNPELDISSSLVNRIHIHRFGDSTMATSVPMMHFSCIEC